MAALSWYYFFYMGFPVNLTFVNAVFAFSATIILALALFLGPLARVIRPFRRRLAYRKTFGLIGYGLASIHVALAAFDVMDRSNPISFSDATSLVFAALAFMIFTIMAVTSTRSWILKLGYPNWKGLQRTGYLALVFVLFHVALLGQGVYLTRTVGMIALSFVLFVLLLRAIVLLLPAPTRKRLGSRPEATVASPPVSKVR